MCKGLRFHIQYRETVKQDVNLICAQCQSTSFHLLDNWKVLEVVHDGLVVGEKDGDYESRAKYQTLKGL